ncbi:MAG: [FeFe] hydrogenase H-cluster radical SAM maturase HydE, partial [Victivallaceae bacterium]
ESMQALFNAAYQVKKSQVGQGVSLRGLIEVGNYCEKNCYYCGIRRDNAKTKRFVINMDEIMFAANEAYEFNYGSVVLQAGERHDPKWLDFITEAVKNIKSIGNGRLGITLSLGEQTAATYERWFEAGAHRYLLRIESSNPALYHKIHPAENHSYTARVNALQNLKKCHYQVGSGVMCGLPFQSVDDLVGDINFFQKIDLDMIGMGPYLPHHDTPLPAMSPADYHYDPTAQLLLGLKMIACTRLRLRDVNIAATTALQGLVKNGRELGLLAGANVIMPNVTPVRFRDSYKLYDNKPGIDENSSEIRRKLDESIAGIGEYIRYGEWGDSPHFKSKKMGYYEEAGEAGKNSGIGGQ